MEFIDQHAWMVNNNLFTDEIKDNIAMVGYCIIEEVVSSSVEIDFNINEVTYSLVLPQTLIDGLNLLNKYKSGAKLGFFETRTLKKFLLKKKENDEGGLGYDLEKIADKFVKGYLNKTWSAKVKIINVKDYNEKEDLQLHEERNSLPN